MSGTAILLVLVLIFILLVVFAVRSAVKAEQAFTSSLATCVDFSPTFSYVSMFGPLSIALDIERQKVAVVPKGGIPWILARAEILAVEVLRDGKSVQKTNRGSQLTAAAVGAVLLGPLDLLLGGLTGSKRTEEKIRNLSLRIFTNHVAVPVLEIIFYQSPGSDLEDSTVKNQGAILTEWDGRLRALLAG